MRIMPATPGLQEILDADPLLNVGSVRELRERYGDIVEAFHEHFIPQVRPPNVENAHYHKSRYLDLLTRPWQGRVLDVGDDKPFLSYFLKKFRPEAEFSVISFALPQSPVDLFEVDIEIEAMPFETNSFDQAICTEVIEHLWRNPSKTVYEIARCLKLGGRLFLTTPNACERHAITCILNQSNPNQRSQYFAALESGHMHLWTAGELDLLLTEHGFRCEVVTTKDYTAYTNHDNRIEALIRKASSAPHLMGETIVIEALKVSTVNEPRYPKKIFPDGGPVRFEGAIKGFARAAMAGGE